MHTDLKYYDSATRAWTGFNNNVENHSKFTWPNYKIVVWYRTSERGPLGLKLLYFLIPTVSISTLRSVFDPPPDFSLFSDKLVGEEAG